MTKAAQAIKAEISLMLEKEGSSAQAFDRALAVLNTGEGVLKVAAAEGGFLQEAIRGGGSLPDLALKLSLAGGAGAGLMADQMDSSVDHLNKSLKTEREKIQLVRRLTENLRREHGLQ